MTTLDVPATARPAQEPRPLRRRIGARQGIANALTLAWRNVTQLKHSPEKLLDVILMPIVFLVLFLYLFGGAVAGSSAGSLAGAVTRPMSLTTSGVVPVTWATIVASSPVRDWSAARTIRVWPPVRAFSSAGVPSATTRPWSMTAIWSASSSASSRYCVVSSTVTPSAVRVRTMSQTSLRLRGSSPVVGSSR